MRRTILILLALLLPCMAWGADATVYVDFTDGNDGNTGASWAQAWKTLTYAESQLAGSGNTAYVLSGTYAEADKLTIDVGVSFIARANKVDSTEGAVTVNTAEGTNNALITLGGNYTKSFTGFTFDCGTVRSQCVNPLATQTQPITFTRCTFTTGKTTGSNYAFYATSLDQLVTLTSCTFTVSGDGIWDRVVYWRGNTGSPAPAPSMLITGGTINVGGGYGVSYHGDGTDTPTCTLSGVTINLTAGVAIDLQCAGTLAVDGCTFTGSGATYATAVQVAGATTATATVTDCTFNMTTKSNNYLVYANQGTKTITVSDNTFTTSETAGQVKELIYILDQSNARITGNTFYVKANSTNAPTLVRVSTSGANLAYYAYIAGNRFYHEDTNSISIAVGNNASDAMQAHYAIIEGNYIEGISQSSTAMVDHHAILVGNSIGAQVRNNIVKGVGYGVVIKGTNATSDWAFHDGIHHNLFVDCAKAGVLFKGVINCPVEHNTFVNMPRAAYAPAGENGQIWLTFNGAGVNALTNRFRYNIFYNHAADIPFVRFSNTDQTLESANYNCYWGNGTWEIDTDTYSTLATWQALDADYDPSSINANPRFVDVNSGDYRLRWNSPCINPYTTGRLTRASDFLYVPQHAWGAFMPVLESVSP